MLEQKGREMLMKDNLIDLNFKSKGDQESEVINDLKNGKAIFELLSRLNLSAVLSPKPFKYS